VVAWFVVALVAEGHRVWVVLHGPPDGDLYANSLDFQLIASLYLLVVLWVPILVGVLLLQFMGFLVLDWFRFRRENRNDVPAA
jgi:hypothetical protein